ncbi:hypothetical protein KY313_00110 [Candidatus Woesearchaeota archaeon]|jgi:hypothetical protein|nr:hypothetical protein [Candidatus Woesearchaeota archaeon]
MVSTFRGALEFFEDIGIYDVILPFLLIFTIVFAILEKTKVFGTEEIEGTKYTKKNLNAMASFVISFMVVASSQLVEIITEVSSHVVILLLVSIFFLILVGSFYKEGDGVFLEGGWKMLFMVIMFLGIVTIFLNAIHVADGRTWWEYFWDFMIENWQADAVASVILLIVVILLMYFITKGPGPKTSKSKEGG